MGNFLPQTLFGLQGQIGRAQFWVGMLLLAGLDLGVTRITEGEFFPDVHSKPWVVLLSAAVVLVLETTLVVKRLRDLQWPTWIAVPFLAVLSAIGVVFSLKLVPDGGTADNILLVIALVGIAAEVVVCGILPGKTRQGQGLAMA